MQAWWLATLLAFAPMAVAQDTAQEAGQAGEVEWPLPWVQGRTLVYADEYRQVSTRDGMEVTIEGTSTTHVEGAPKGDGYRQRWRSEGMDIQVRGMESMAATIDMQAVMTSAGTALEGMVVEIDLDGEGAYTGIANLDALVGRMRSVMQGMFDDMFSTLRKQEPVQPGQWQAFVEALLAQIASPEVLEAGLSEAPLAFNYMAGGGLEPGRTYSFEDQGELPIGNAPVARSHQLRVAAAVDAPGKYDATWTVALDRNAVRDAVVAMMDEAAAATLPELEGLGTDALAEGIDVSTTVVYRIDGASGIVERMRMKTTKRFADRLEVETLGMRLREVRGP